MGAAGRRAVSLPCALGTPSPRPPPPTTSLSLTLGPTSNHSTEALPPPTLTLTTHRRSHALDAPPTTAAAAAAAAASAASATLPPPLPLVTGVAPAYPALVYGASPPPLGHVGPVVTPGGDAPLPTAHAARPQGATSAYRGVTLHK